MPRRTRYAGLDVKTLGGRFEHLLQIGWGGRQREMAADLGVSQGLISKVARGEQAPGPKLIEALSGHPKVNARWLLEGVGEPLAAVRPSVPSADLSVPVSRCILPGRPEEHTALLTGFRLQVEAFFRPSTYLLEVQADDPVVRVPELRIAVGDMLVMEADRNIWLKNWPVLTGKLVALRLGGERGVDFMLARADLHPMTRELAFDCFGVRVGPTPDTKLIGGVDQGEGIHQPEPAAEASGVSTANKKTSKMNIFRGSSAGTPVKTDPVRPTPPTERVPETREEAQQALPSIDDVVGYSILLIRM